MKQENFILIISSPSGAGKTSLSRQLLKEDSRLCLSVSATTRKIRPGEVEGKDYYFIDIKEYKEMLLNKEFLEDAQVFDNYYGSPKKHIMDKLQEGKDILFDIDWQGAQTLKEKLGPLVVSIFILPPSMSELKRRLKSRGQDSDEVVDRRMERAKAEISKYGLYDYVLINKDFDKTLARISSIIAAERLRFFDFSKFVEDLMK
jgi:guanylate kinase